ncbi:aryl-alcohol dehydrogenase-like predicted oxidoreductase [Geothermobacter ehrlichii]|uniref:Aryl-alcohol dehydrogenase-like predicted oxidoreductase n=1 Tax=Geothermobacter ehrlichii TaxID=213224 RepID=A0A5D3WJC5_9BACT|nr:aldo/keto reductase [Geothermobacter ehrlichii]TYO98365.1 aryl-alcohol dehydrogenase-like predicted oxidoreductase [Geothermobacter ehrlichii]
MTIQAEIYQSKLAIGTAQFGMDYGISNSKGRTPEKEVARILKMASVSNINILDTAPAYGRSEEIIGHVISGLSPFKIITKTKIFEKGLSGRDVAEQLGDTFKDSLERLGVESVYGLMVHQPCDLLSESGMALFEAMEMLQEQGLVKKIGVSVYTAEQIEQCMMRYPIQLMQVPVSVLDQRLLLSGHLTSLKNADVEVHARSIFLQGLLLVKPEDLPPYFEGVKKNLDLLRNAIEESGYTPVQAALGFVNALDEVNAIVCGVSCLEEFEELIDQDHVKLPSEFLDSLRAFALDDPNVLNPSLWRVAP